MNSTGFELTDILSAIDQVLNDFQLAHTLNVILQALCGLVVVWQFSQVTIQNLLRGGEGFSFEMYKKPVFYIIMIAAWPTLQDFIIDASNGIAYTITEQQEQAFAVNQQNYKKIEDTVKEIEDRFNTTVKTEGSDNIAWYDEFAFNMSILDDKLTLAALQATYKASLLFDSFLYVMFYFFTKLWLKITLIGGGIAFTVSLLTGGWTVLINWAKTVISVSLWIPVSALLMTLINSILLKILNNMTPVLPEGTDYSGSDALVNAELVLGNLVSSLLTFIVLTIVFLGFKLIILAKVPSIVSGWLSGGGSVSGGFAASFIPVSMGKSAAKSMTGSVSSAANSGGDSFKK